MRDSNTDEQQALAYRFADVALPAEATDCYPWGCYGEDDWRRGFLVREWDVAAIWVSVAGEQDHHGTVSRWLHATATTNALHRSGDD
jgi:hypothetical protein